MKYKKSWLHEVDRFARTMEPVIVDRTDVGLEQFHCFESRGVRPLAEDPYFTLLWNGKRWWEWTLNKFAGMYGTNDWPGWWQLCKDFKGDWPGLRQVILRCGRPEMVDEVRFMMTQVEY